MRDVHPAEPDEEPPAAADSADSLPDAAALMRPKGALSVRKRVTILFFAANADPERLLAIGREHDAIDRSIRSSQYRDHFLLVTKLGGRFGDLHQALLDHCPEVVHFACHGSDRAELLLAGDDGGVASVPPSVLSETFRVLQDNMNLKLVTFNACFSGAQAEAVRESVRLAIGMERPIEWCRPRRSARDKADGDRP
jgi:CHAT domain-containing protein